MDWQKATRQLDAIHGQLARANVFRGYRAVTVGFSGVVAVVGAVAQHWLLPHASLRQFVLLWVALAAVNVVVVTVELTVCGWFSGSLYRRRQTIEAIASFLPAIVVGAVMTVMIVASAGESGWMLPGLWSLVFGLGVFASRSFLPNAVTVAGVYYVLVGGVVLRCGPEHAFEPWTMGLSFGAGQLLTAGILYATLERRAEGADS